MRTSKPFLMLCAVLAVGVGPAMADDDPGAPPSHSTGVQNAIDRIEQATQKHIEVLTDLLSKVPDQAQSGIQRAIEAAQKGHDKALAALNAHLSGQESETAETESPGGTTRSEHGGKPSTTGLERARDAVAAAFDKSVSTLERVIGEAPDQARPRIEAALARVQETRVVALQNLDRLLASERPDRAAAADRPDRGGRPDRPERPERPERPQPPERPERPEVPDHPGPPRG